MIARREPSHGAWQLFLGAAADDQQARVAGFGDPGFGQARSETTVAVLRQLQKEPCAMYRDLWGTLNDLAQQQHSPGAPGAISNATDDQLLDSPAFRPLNW